MVRLLERKPGRHRLPLPCSCDGIHPDGQSSADRSGSFDQRAGNCHGTGRGADAFWASNYDCASSARQFHSNSGFTGWRAHRNRRCDGATTASRGIGHGGCCSGGSRTRTIKRRCHARWCAGGVFADCTGRATNRAGPALSKACRNIR
ncbi:MAG: hypothetical protein R3D67_05300 [Hyphomicrobiaceae bacterium]